MAGVTPVVGSIIPPWAWVGTEREIHGLRSNTAVAQRPCSRCLCARVIDMLVVAWFAFLIRERLWEHGPHEVVRRDVEWLSYLERRARAWVWVTDRRLRLDVEDSFRREEKAHI